MDPRYLETRLNLIDARLAKIESHLNISSVPVPKAPAYSATADESIASQPSNFKTGNWLGIVAILCFVLAAAFIVKLSIDSGWLTHARQLGLAYLLGFALIGAGLALMRADREYASFLPAGGIIVLYLTTYAGYQLYGLISYGIGISITSVVSILCLLLYLKFRHDIYAIIAAVGTYASPLILGSYGNPIFTLYYFVLCSLAFAAISIWVSSRIFTIIGAYLAIFANTLLGLDLNIDKLIAMILPIHFLIFSIGAVLYTRITGYKLTKKEAWSFFPVLVLFYTTEYYFIDRAYPGLAPWISLFFAAFLLLLYYAARQWISEQSLNSQPVILAFATVVFFHSVYLELLPDYMCAWVFVAIVMLFAMIPMQLYDKDRIKEYGIPVLGLSVICALEYINLVGRYLSLVITNIYWLIVGFAAIGSLWFLYIRKREYFSTQIEQGYALLIATHLLAIAELYNIADKHGSLAISLSWLVYAIGVMAYGFSFKDKIIANSSLIILSFATAKVLLYDVSAAPTIVRILCLLFTGAVLYGAGFLFKKIAAWKT